MGNRKFDEYQKKAIEVLKNAVVSAGAGSGKTTVLSQRFLHLVQDLNYNVDEILTLTFTKKATVEMSSRIYKVLLQNAPEKAADFFKANIKTLDGYCNSVAKMGARFYGITPDFSQDSTINQRIQEMALPFILEHRDNLAVKALVQSDNIETKAHEIFVKPILENSTVAEPVDFKKAVEKQVESVTEAWKTYSSKAAYGFSAMQRALGDFEGNKNTAYVMNLEAFFENYGLPDAPELETEDILSSEVKKLSPFMQALESLSSSKLPGNMKGGEEFSEIHRELRDLFEKLNSVINYINTFPLLQSLIPLLEKFQEMVNDFKRRTGRLTFKDISNLALCTLKEHPEIRLIEKNKYKAIMIDEFQDNNSDQRDMLFLLAEKPERMEKSVPTVEELCPEKLFFVGDEKQSIYKFRGADVSVFRALSKDFSEGNLSMATNYRSRPALIGAFNTFFGGFPYPPDKEAKNTSPCVFFTERKDCSQVADYEAVYHEVTMSEDAEKVVHNGDVNTLFAPAIHFALYDCGQNEEYKGNSDYYTFEDAEAEWVAEKIQVLIKKGRKYSDIAILFRDYAYQPLYERTLLRHGIPYNTEVVTGFFNDGPVNDIFSVLRLCAYPDDTLSYANLLRSPFANLEIEEVNAILSMEQKPFEAESFDFLSAESSVRYAHLRDCFMNISSVCQFSSLTELVSKIWYEFGYHYETLWNNTVQMYSKLYDIIFELARKSEQESFSLASFVDSVETYKDQAEKLGEMDIPLEQVSGVHILTIHKSKGLEYPVVFICGTQKQSVRDANRGAVYASKEYGITINRPGASKENYFYNLISELNKDMAAAELRRLVYVAITRAKEEVYITNGKYEACDDSGKYIPGGTARPETVFQILLPVFEYFTQDDFKGIKPFDVEEIKPVLKNFEISDGRRPNTENAKLELIKNLEKSGAPDKSIVVETEYPEKKYLSPSKLHAEAEYYLPAGSALPEEIPFAEVNEIISRMPKFSYENFGTVAHAYMEAAVKNQKEAEYSAKELCGLDGKEEYIQKVKNICLQMQKAFVESETGKEVMASEWKKAEYEFRGKLDGKLVRGVIDLVYKNPDGTYTVLDYKTNQTLQPELYYEQLSCYRRIISNMLGLPLEKILCKLYYLRFSRVVDITANLQ